MKYFNYLNVSLISKEASTVVQESGRLAGQSSQGSRQFAIIGGKNVSFPSLCFPQALFLNPKSRRFTGLQGRQYQYWSRSMPEVRRFLQKMLLALRATTFLL